MNRLFLTVLLALPILAWADEPNYARKEIIYGRKFGTALTMDVFSPKENVNGAAIIFAVSEGWYSNHASIEPNISSYVRPFVSKGYTVFAVCHGSSPKFSLPEILEDMHCAVRFIRHHAKEYGIDPVRIGIMGDSAGGHLSLMQGCASRQGNAEAPDPLDRESSRVQAVVAYFPPTDFLNWGQEGKLMLGTHPIVQIKGAFDFHRLDIKTNSFRLITDPLERIEIGKAVSPIFHVSKDDAPTLIVHGDSDMLIPVQQSRIMVASLKQAGVPSELVVMKGGGHDEILVNEHLPNALTWFGKYLVTKVEPAETR